jgi:hypothetical protein
VRLQSVLDDLQALAETFPDATVAATTAASPGDLKDRLLGDGLVPVMSALGRHKESARDLKFPADRQWIACETGHLDLLSRRDVYERMAGWLAQT